MLIKEYVDFIHSKADKPFEWGIFDCCLFACDVIEIQTGIDPAKDIRGYSTSMEAMKILKERGGVEGVAETICAENGWKEIDPRRAQRMDVVLVENGAGRFALCVVDLNGKEVIGAGAIGTARFPISEAIRAWRIPKCHN